MKKQTVVKKKRITESTGMPKGIGLMRLRGRVYWISYVDAEGKRRQINTHCTEYDEARRFLARKALEVLEPKVALLREIADEPQAKAGGRTAANPRDEQLDDVPRYRSGRRSVRKDSTGR